MNENNQTMEAFVPKLTLNDRLEIIKGKRAFPLVFPICMLIFLLIMFSLATHGRFLTANVFKGIFNQSLIVH